MNQSFELTPTRLRELRAFAAAARRLNFSRAALEEAVGARLFLRTTRRMALTARGEQLLAQWQRMETVMTELAAGRARRGTLFLRHGAGLARRWC